MATENHSQFQFAAERYVLGELSEQETLAFEEHFFSCHACAQDLDDLMLIREAAPAVLPQLAAVPASLRKHPGKFWLFSGWRPQLVLGALAALAVLTGYQNTVEIPRLVASASGGNELQFSPAPQRLKSMRSAGEVTISAKDRLVPLLIGDEWPDGYASYQAKITKRGSTQPLSIGDFTGIKGGLTVHVPASKLGPGEFELMIFGNREGAEPKPVAQFFFNIQETTR